MFLEFNNLFDNMAYVYPSTFIGMHMILDMRRMTHMLNLFLWFFKVFTIFLALINLYCSKTYYYTIIYPETLKYWVGVQWSQSYLIGKRCLFSLRWPPFQWWYCNKNTLWGRCLITSTSLAPLLFLLHWLKLNLILLLDQLRLA